MSLPSHHLALVLSKDGQATLTRQTIPTAGAGELLVRVRAIGIEPSTWKEYDQSTGRFTVKDGGAESFAGDIVAIGEDTNDGGWHVGQPVTGYRCGHCPIQEFIVIDPHSYQPLHHDRSWLPHDVAPPMEKYALCQIVKALHHCLAMPFELATPEPFFVWDGCHGSGLRAVQLACLAGYNVVTTAFDHERTDAFSAGAAAVFDYGDPFLISRVRKWAREKGGGPLKKGLDAIGLPGTVEKCMSILEEGGELVTLSPIKEDLDLNHAGVHVKYVFDPPKPGAVDEGQCRAEWNRRMPAYLQSGKLPRRLVPLKVFKGGIADLPKVIGFMNTVRGWDQDVVVTMG